MAVLEEMPGRVDAPSVVYTGGDVLSRWRAAERQLDTLAPGSEEAIAVEAEIDHLRGLYQGLFPARLNRDWSGQPGGQHRLLPCADGER